MLRLNLRIKGDLVKRTLALKSTSILKVSLKSRRVPEKGDPARKKIIMIVDAIYDFMTVKKINKLRYKQFKNLKKLHHKAFIQHIFFF